MTRRRRPFAFQRPRSVWGGQRAESFDFSHRRLQRGVEVVPVECLEEAVTQDALLEPVAQFGERQVDADRVELVVELLEHPGRRDVHVGDCLTLQDDPGGGRSRARRRTCSRKMPELAKKSGASQRYTTIPGRWRASGYLSTPCHPGSPSTCPSTAP